MTLLGPFQLTEALGQGGMGQVWAGRHLATGQEVAIKLVAARYGSHPSLRQAFRREVRAVAALDHPAVVRVLDQGQVEAPILGMVLNYQTRKKGGGYGYGYGYSYGYRGKDAEAAGRV